MSALLNEKDLIERLNLVKQEFIRLKQEQAVSIRKDVAKVELLDIVSKSKNYEELKENITNYANSLLDNLD